MKKQIINFCISLVLLSSCSGNELNDSNSLTDQTNLNIVSAEVTDNVSIEIILTPDQPNSSISALPTIQLQSTPIVLEGLINFQESEQDFPHSSTREVAFGDIDNDGDLDAVFANMKMNYSRVWLNDGNGVFSQTEQQLTMQGHGVELADLDNDGDLDAVIVCATYNSVRESTKIYLNNGTGTFVDTEQDLGDFILSGDEVEIIDYDHDGNMDIHVSYYPKKNVIYLNDGNGEFSKGDEYSFDAINWGDLDSNGIVDMFVRDFSNGQMYRVFTNDGFGIYTEIWQMHDPKMQEFGAIAIEDFNGSGYLDIFIANGIRENQQPSLVLINMGDNSFQESGQHLPITNMAHIVYGDINDDGAIDIFIANGLMYDYFLLNDGQGFFIDSGLVFDASVHSTNPTLGDIDNDGDLDLIFGSYQSPPDFWINLLNHD